MEKRTEPSPDLFDRECKVMDRFIANAKSYIQISGGALVLSITFLQEVVGIPKDQKVQPGGLLISAWICFLMVILAGAAYEYFAVKFLEWKSGVARNHRNPLEPLIRHPWPMYALMLLGFYAGSSLFTLAAIERLQR
jgi:hypothetical protein